MLVIKPLRTASLAVLAAAFFVFSADASAQASQFFGATSDGGVDKEGALYKTDGEGENFELLYNFQNLDIQDVRHVKLLEAIDGKLYGTSVDGGASGDGTIFEYDPSTGNTTVLYSFENTIEGRSPFGGLIQVNDSLLYGMLCYGGPTDDGIIFSYDIATMAITIRHQFDGTNGERPQSTLMESSSGLLYGVTRFGGANDDGVLFEFDPTTDTYTSRFEFDQATTGDRPYSGLLEATDGLFYGMTFTGGTHDHGVLYSYDPVSFAYTKLHELLDSVSGRKPYGTLIEAADGHLYGTVFKGGTEDKGALCRYDIALDSFAVVGSFNAAVGENPQSGLFEASNGLLYGTTDVGGQNGVGTIYSFDIPSANFSTIVDFDESVGHSSYATPMEAADNKLYVATRLGTAGENGSLLSFELTSTAFEVAAWFNLAVEGRDPLGGLLMASDSLLYGVTHKGGIYNDGTLFKLDPQNGSFEKLADFCDSLTGSRPRTTLIQAVDGKLYGTALNGGIFNDGTIFSYDISSALLTKRVDLHTVVSGKRPAGALTEAGGMLYGITELGGAANGTLFAFDPLTDGLVVKHDFDTINGMNAQGALTLADDGKLYGVVDFGGPGGEGVLYSFDPVSDVYQLRHSFDALVGTGATPRCQPVQATDGLLYGATNEGGPSGEAVIYSFDIGTGNYNVVATLDLAVFGEVPIGRLMQAVNGKIYGVTNGKGPGGAGGTLFEFDPLTAAVAVKQDFEEPIADDPFMVPTELSLCSDFSTSLVDSACFSYTSPGGQVITASGLYSDTLLTALGCDSIFNIDLTVIDLDNAILINDSSLVAVQSGSTYQWLDCDNGNSPIAGATSQNFIPDSAGSYAVVVSNGGCSITSLCASFVISGLSIDPTELPVSLYPNPTTSNVVLEMTEGRYLLRLFDLQGNQILEESRYVAARYELATDQLSAGLYLLRISNEIGETTLKLVKE